MSNVFSFSLRFEATEAWVQLVSGVAITTISWILVALLTRPTSLETMVTFINQVNPGGPGWKPIVERAKREGLPVTTPEGKWKVPIGIICMIAGTIGIYSFLMATGLVIYGRYLPAMGLIVVLVVAVGVINRLRPRISE